MGTGRSGSGACRLAPADPGCPGPVVARAVTGGGVRTTSGRTIEGGNEGGVREDGRN